MDYYEKYLKYKNKYLELKQQLGGKVIINYFKYFYDVTTYDTLNKILRPILYDYWAEISKCYGLTNPANFDYDSAIQHPKSNIDGKYRTDPALHRESIVVFLSDHVPVHSSYNNIITWNVGFGYDDELYNYLGPFWFRDKEYTFRKPADTSRLINLKAKLIAKYIKFYKNENTIVNLQECSSKLYTLIRANFDSEHFSSKFLPQTLVTLPMDLNIKHSKSYYTSLPETYNKSGLCTFAFFPDRDSIREINLIPSIVSVFKPNKTDIYNITCRACKIVGLDSSNIYYNVHLDGEKALTDTRKLLKNKFFIFQVVRDELTIKSNIYDKILKIITENCRTNELLKIFEITKDSVVEKYIYGNEPSLVNDGTKITLTSSITGQIIISGDFNVKWSLKIDDSSKIGDPKSDFYSKTICEAYKINSDSTIDYILFNTP